MASITDFHEQYIDLLPVWDICRDAAKGQRAIARKTELYLPKLAAQSSDSYAAYLARANWYPAMGRTIEGMSGLIFRKEPDITVPDAMAPWLEDITLTGKSIGALLRDVVDEVMTTGRYGILVDHTRAPETPAGTALTRAQAQALDLRPFFKAYDAKAIRYWEHGRVGNRTQLIDVRLTETYLDADGNKKDQIRQLKLDGVYRQIVWREGTESNKAAWVIVEEFVPVKAGKPLTMIPFYFQGPKMTTGDVLDPPLEGLAYVNIAHFRNSADYENGIHMSGLPTPWVSGITQKQGETIEIHVGSDTAIILPKDGQAGYMQVGDKGFFALREAMQDKKLDMATLGARLIAPEKKDAETAEASQIKRGAESSVLADMAGAISHSVRQALVFFADWGGFNGNEVGLELNRDYAVMNMDPAMLRELIAGVQGGLISQESFFEKCRAGGLFADDLSFEEEQGRKESDPPPLGTMVDVNA